MAIVQCTTRQPKKDYEKSRVVVGGYLTVGQCDTKGLQAPDDQSVVQTKKSEEDEEDEEDEDEKDEEEDEVRKRGEKINV